MLILDKIILFFNATLHTYSFFFNKLLFIQNSFFYQNNPYIKFLNSKK
uniref:Uncharacterized protein n=1 Tax=Bartonella rochalimae ATCC BAA-1498 TaxID=685782 RepID=E6YM37_9HYPH|nr:hypothetical protein BARRO_50288 [Bartonella rochalimae ATCC BAA-1498]